MRAYEMANAFERITAVDVQSTPVASAKTPHFPIRIRSSVRRCPRFVLFEPGQPVKPGICKTGVAGGATCGTSIVGTSGMSVGVSPILEFESFLDDPSPGFGDGLSSIEIEMRWPTT